MGRYRKPLEAVLIYKDHSVSPEDFLHFIELKQFTSAWEDLGLNDEDDLTALQIIIMANPSQAPIIQGTGGLRKLRFTSPESQTGKSGAFEFATFTSKSFQSLSWPSSIRRMKKIASPQTRRKRFEF